MVLSQDFPRKAACGKSQTMNQHISPFFLLVALTPALFLSQHRVAAQAPQGACPSGQHWVRAHFRKAYRRTDGTLVSATNVRAHCQPNPPSYSTWKDRLRSNPSGRWILRKEKPRKWTTEEEERILDALSDLPPALLSDSVKAIYRFEKSSLFDQNPASGEPGERAVYDRAFGKKTNLARILAHEFAHEMYRRLSDTEKDQYRVAAEWLLPRIPGTGEYQLIPNRDDAAYVEEDGSESMTEDFSNNVEYFLFEPKALQKKTPRVYEWIKKKFGDNFKAKGR
jgi:hypothetical protein